MTNPAELTVQRRITKAFINTMPEAIVLTPRVRVKQTGGGYKWTDGSDRPVQTLRLVEPGSYPIPVRTVDGIEREVLFMLLGEYDAAMGVYDVFVHDGAYWEVVFLYKDNGWERRAEVARHG